MAEEIEPTETVETVETPAATETPATTETTPAQPAATTETPPAATETPAAPESLREKMEKIAEKVKEDQAAAKKTETPEEKAAAEAAKTTAAAGGAFTPKLKYRVPDLSPEAQARSRNATMEKEIPKEFHGMMKDAASEKLVHDLFTKADGLDVLKNQIGRERAETQEIVKQRDNLQGAVNGAAAIYNDAVQKQDYLKLDGFFKRIGVKEDVVMQYALAKAKYAEMQPAERAIIDARLEADNRAAELLKQNQGALSQTQRLELQMKSLVLDTRLERPDVSALAKVWDEQAGQPGAFRNEVINQGQIEWARTQKDITPEEAIALTIKRLNIKAPAAGASATETPPAATATTTTTPAAAARQQPAPGTKIVVERKVGTIPNLQGNSASPIKKGPNSVEDLKKLRDQKIAEARGAAAI
jgi:hypothetical protein